MTLRDLMTPKSEDDILKSLKGLSNSDLLRKSIKYDFLKGVELALQNKLKYNDVKYIKNKIFDINNKEIIKLLLLNKFKLNLTKVQIYIIEKYLLRLHQDEETTYEIWFKEQLINLKKINIKQDNDNIFYKKDDEILLFYDKKYKIFWIDYDKIWSIFKLKYHLNDNVITLLTKNMVQKYLNLNEITINCKRINYKIKE
jgi:hypothetical protein